MELLPNEIVLKIFKELPVEQTLICKLVNKRFYSIINDLMKLKSLIIIDNYYSDMLSKWFYDNEFIRDCKYKITGRRLGAIKFNSNQLILNQLKKLYITHRSLLIDTINCLDQLEVLEINCCKLKGKGRLLIDLPNLKSFSFIYNNSTKNPMIFNTPKLVKLEFSHNDYLDKHFNYPESIKEFYCCFIESFIKKFINLELLFCERFYFKEDVLLKLKKLKELHFNSDKLEGLVALKRQKNRLNSDVKIYFLGVNLDAIPLIDSKGNMDEIPAFHYRYYGFYLNEKTVEFYCRNYFNLSIDYNLLEIHFNQIQQAPKELIKKLDNLKELVLTNEISDLDQFITKRSSIFEEINCNC